LKTRMLAPLDKARVVQFFLWIEKYDEADTSTHKTGPLSKKSLDLHKMSAFKFLSFWELPEEALQLVTRGMALHTGPMKRLKKVPAIELVRRLKRYKDAYRTFPHMTSPYIYPVGGFGLALAKTMAKIVEANGGACLLGRPVDQILQGEDGAACGVVCDGVSVHADCVVAAPEYVTERVAETHQVVRLYAVLTHAPNLCKDASSCQLILPAAAVGRAHDIYMVSSGPTHGVAPKGKWVVMVSARVEGSTEGVDAMAVAKRELSAVMPLLKPSRRMFAEVVSQLEAQEEGQLDNLLVLKSLDESTHFDSVEHDVEDVFERITGERIASLRRPGA